MGRISLQKQPPCYYQFSCWTTERLVPSAGLMWSIFKLQSPPPVMPCGNENRSSWMNISCPTEIILTCLFFRIQDTYVQTENLVKNSHAADFFLDSFQIFCAFLVIRYDIDMEITLKNGTKMMILYYIEASPHVSLGLLLSRVGPPHDHVPLWHCSARSSQM